MAKNKVLTAEQEKEIKASIKYIKDLFKKIDKLWASGEQKDKIHAMTFQSILGIHKNEKLTKEDKDQVISQIKDSIINPPPPKTIMHKGHKYVLASSVKSAGGTSSRCNEDADIMRDRSILDDAKSLINNNQYNPYGNERR